MSRISYFQRFSQKENHATNNTLLLLRHMNNTSPRKLQNILSALTETELSIGASFEQQIRREHSIPDALIIQEAIHIYIETKDGAPLTETQMENHIKSIVSKHRGVGTNILLTITKEPASASLIHKLADAAREEKIVFTSITFAQVCEEARKECADFEQELAEIVEDYAHYLSDSKLLDETGWKMPIFACGTSLMENAKYSVYYEPSSRPSKHHYRYIGVYANKAVQYVGQLEKVTVAQFDDNKISLRSERGDNPEAERDWINEVISNTKYYDLTDAPHRFYRVDYFAPTELKKKAGSLRGMIYLDLRNVDANFDLKKNYSSEELAEFLRGKSFS